MIAAAVHEEVPQQLHLDQCVCARLFTDPSADACPPQPRKPCWWTVEAQRSFKAVQEVRCVFADHHLDAYAIGTGAVVYQLGDDGTRCIISHALAKFTKAEKGTTRVPCSSVGAPQIQVLAAGRSLHLANAQQGLDLSPQGARRAWQAHPLGHVPHNELPDALSCSPGNEAFRVDKGVRDALVPPQCHYGEVLHKPNMRTVPTARVPRTSRKPTNRRACTCRPLPKNAHGHHNDNDLARHPGVAEILRRILREYC